MYQFGMKGRNKRHKANPLFLGALLFAALFHVDAQTVEVTATTNQKAVDAILKKVREEAAANRAFYDERGKCRAMMRARAWTDAEKSCRTAVVLVEKLPKEQVLERSSARTSLAVLLLLNQRPKEAIALLEEALAISQGVTDDSDAETGEIYFLLGRAHHISGDVERSRSYYERAERTYRTAFIEIGDSELRYTYGQVIKDIVEAHLDLLRSAGLRAEAEKLDQRLVQVEKDFSDYLRN